jgi:hypothetical protein
MTLELDQCKTTRTDEDHHHEKAIKKRYMMKGKRNETKTKLTTDKAFSKKETKC